MAINPSTKIQLADMTALAVLANGKSALAKGPGQDGFNYTAGGQKEPFFPLLVSVQLASQGKDYKVGENLLVSGYYYAYKLLVTAVDSIGGITAFISHPNWYADPNPSPIPLIYESSPAGQGTGATVTLTWYPNSDRDYAFNNLPPYNPTTAYNDVAYGWATELLRMRNNLAVLFQPGDPDLCVSGPWPVDGPSWTFKDNAFYYADTGQTETVSLNVGVNGGYGPFSTSNTIDIITVYQQPVQGGNYYATNPQAHIIEASASIIVEVSEPGLLQADFYFRLAASQGAQGSNLNDQSTWSIVMADPSQLVSIVTDLGLGTSEIFYTGEFVYVVWHVNQVVSAGRYTAAVRGGIGNSSAVEWLGPGGSTLGYPRRCGGQFYSAPYATFDRGYILDVAPFNYYPNATPGGPQRLGKDFSAAVDAIGIHNSKAIKKISVGSFSGNVVGCRNECLNYSACFVSPFPQPTFGPEYYGNEPGGAPIYNVPPAVPGAYSATVEGFWSAKTPPITQINALGHGEMPWNITFPKEGTTGYNPMTGVPVNIGANWYVPTSYDHALNLEDQKEPPVWKSHVWRAVGDIIFDSNKNQQTCTVAGLSGRDEPGWPPDKDAIVQEYVDVAGVVGATWKTTLVDAALTVTQAPHRFDFNIPKYPTYWKDETIACLKPPTGNTDAEKTLFGCGSQWEQFQSTNMVYGSWIYSVSINRLGEPVNAEGSSLPKSGQVAVTIGCIRNGAFVAFGTYQTGQSVQVLWPIFTSDALVYQCEERVDVQVLAIAWAVSIWIPTTGEPYNNMSVNAPICAAHYNDTEALLNLIP